MAENIINKVLKDERPFYQQAFENSIDALPDDLSTGHGKAMYTPNGIVDRAQSVGDYHKMANADLSNRISNKIGENYGNLAQAGYNLFSPALSIPASFGYDYSQAKDRMEPDSGIMGLGKAFMDESPFSAAYQRAVGVADPFFQQFGMTTVPENALKNNLRPANINFTNLLQQDVNKDIYNGYKSEQPADAISRTNVQGMDLEMDPGAFMNPNIQPSQNMFQRAGNFVKDLELEEYLPFIGERALTGMLGRGIGNLFQNIAPARYGYSTDRFNRMTPGQQSYTSNLYGPGGLLQGYNQKSAFGLGALGTLGNRLTAIQNRKAPQTDFSRQRQQEIKDAINETINTGEREALADPNRSVKHPGSNIRTRTDIDVADGGAETSGGKIVCTMMNDSYGFGNFRNKIWLKHSRDLPKEYEVGYHKIFLPLVKFAKGEGKINKVVKKTLEHIARHRTLDLKQEMKGKTHTLGRVYRKILEPICFLVGKASMFVRRG